MYIFAGFLGALWLLGEVCHYTAGGMIHLLLIIAVIVILIKFNLNRKGAIRSQQRGRSKQVGGDLGAPKTWHLK
jgi:hypothetical protein